MLRGAWNPAESEYGSATVSLESSKIALVPEFCAPGIDANRAAGIPTIFLYCEFMSAWDVTMPNGSSGCENEMVVQSVHASFGHEVAWLCHWSPDRTAGRQGINA